MRCSGMLGDDRCRGEGLVVEIWPDAPTTLWRPIATAPKDGTPILACIEGYATAKGQFVLHPSQGPITVFWGTYHPNSPGQKAWRDGSGIRRPHLTHWMPLLEPPLIDAP
jgi:hypothetical protein